MFELLRKLMNGIINLVDKVKCNFTCCTNTVYVSVPSDVSPNMSRQTSPFSRETSPVQ